MSKKKYIEMTIPDRSANLVAKVHKEDYARLIEICNRYNLSVSNIMRVKIEEVLKSKDIIPDNEILLDDESSILNFRVSKDLKYEVIHFANMNGTNVNQVVKGIFKDLLTDLLDSSEEHC